MQNTKQKTSKYQSVELYKKKQGEDELSGNVFAVNSDGFFGPVCDDGWDINAATVVCRHDLHFKCDDLKSIQNVIHNTDSWDI